MELFSMILEVNSISRSWHPRTLLSQNGVLEREGNSDQPFDFQASQS
uniref:Uncharacterized protein n=1 Tax=Nelumbo nucifera TaxID=4432 RepID=A0A822XS45_NELNU|nr:TPA_asm: hypothetical protein HUJ06_021771 [Nelumbo nucifera]